MKLANRSQKLQDWFTQQWAIFWGQMIKPDEFPWLIGPFGDLKGIGVEFIERLAASEGLKVRRNNPSAGLIPKFREVGFTDDEIDRLAISIIDFYEITAQYELDLAVKWNPVFRYFGLLVNTFFSKRLDQLNIPIKNTTSAESVKSEIIELIDPETETVKYIFWLRRDRSTGQVIYSGIYGTCQLPSGKTCVKAVFPLPNGNATVIMSPSVGIDGELILDSSGNSFGDAGFYFLLKDANGNTWSQYVRSFRDKLIVKASEKNISAEQTLTLWHLTVVKFKYKIMKVMM